MTVVLYALLLALLVVRVAPAGAPRPEPIRPPAGEPLWLTTLHHGLLGVVLLSAPLERLLGGGAPGGRLAGAVLFASGVVLYRVAGRALGRALSPFTAPRPGAPLVTAGPYRWLRHPMYVGQALVALGAPLLLGCRYLIALALADVALLGLRAAREEAALGRAFPGYARYAARTKRVVPFLC
jgi:protein-S-isoprenylcysteine O-methyltransferase Ste14